MNITEWRRSWASLWHQKADRLRTGWAESMTQWEADTEPGYPLPPFSAAVRNFGLAVADLYDAIGGKR